MTNTRPRVSATQAKILADLKRFSAGGPIARVYAETVGLREDIADAIREGVPLDVIVQSVAMRCNVDRRSAIEGLRQNLDGLGLDLSVPRGHRPKKDSLRGDLRSAALVTGPQPEPVPTPAPVAPTPAAGARKDQAPNPSPAPAAPLSLPDIPRGERTHTECEKLAVRHFAQRYGGRNPAHIKAGEVSTAELNWLEKLWDLTAPVNPDTGGPYRIKSFTAAGRPLYDKPFIPRGAFKLKSGGFIENLDDDLRADMKKFGAGLTVFPGASDELQVVLPDGKLSVPFPDYSVNGILRGMMPDIRRIAGTVRDVGGPVSPSA